MSHTKGPWKIDEKYKTAINAGGKHIAMVSYYKSQGPDHAQSVFGEEHESNARIIAAAPDMYEALEKLYAILDTEEESFGIVNDILAKINELEQWKD